MPVSGKVDAVRLPKQLDCAHRVVGNTKPRIHVIGPWSYPVGTVKTIHMVANTPQVELFVSRASVGKSSSPGSSQSAASCRRAHELSEPTSTWRPNTIGVTDSACSE